MRRPPLVPSNPRETAHSGATGPATAGGAYTPGMSDYTVFVKGRATAYLGGPPLVKMAIDEVVDEETLGGAEMHSRISGLSDYLAVDELACGDCDVAAEPDAIAAASLGA